MILSAVHWGTCRVRAVLSGQHNGADEETTDPTATQNKNSTSYLTLSDVIKRLVRIVWPGAISTDTANNGKNVNNTLEVIDLEPSSIAIKERQGQGPSQSPANLPHILIYGKYIHSFFSTIFHLFFLSVFIGREIKTSQNDIAVDPAMERQCI